MENGEKELFKQEIVEDVKEELKQVIGDIIKTEINDKSLKEKIKDFGRKIPLGNYADVKKTDMRHFISAIIIFAWLFFPLYYLIIGMPEDILTQFVMIYSGLSSIVGMIIAWYYSESREERKEMSNKLAEENQKLRDFIKEKIPEGEV